MSDMDEDTIDVPEAPPAPTLRRYRSTQQVLAAMVLRVIPFNDNGDATIYFVGGGKTSVCGEWIRRFRPRPGGFFVRVREGEAGYLSADAFTQNYAPVE